MRGGVGVGISGSGSCCEGGFTVTTGESFIDFILEISSCKEVFLVITIDCSVTCYMSCYML